jgi:cytochrome c5
MFRTSLTRRTVIVGAMACTILATGCAQKMARQPRYKPYSPSDFFADGLSARPLVPDTVSREDTQADEQFNTGMVGGKPVDSFPFPVTKAVLLRGKERFDIFCSMCHGRTGAGDGMIVRRGYKQPPSFHTDRLRGAPVGHFFDVITNGFGAMPSYATDIPVRDRWAIVGYIRALQLSQHATPQDAPPEERQQFERGVIL